MRDHQVTRLTDTELQRARRELAASLALARPDSPARVPILAHMNAIDAELAERAGFNRQRLSTARLVGQIVAIASPAHGSNLVTPAIEGTEPMRKARARTHSGAAAEIQQSDEQWRKKLTPEQYAVLRGGHTERPFTGEYVHTKEDGSYCCAACGSELFRSDAKFDSGTGWPSFSEPAIAQAVELRPDNSLLMRRTEVLCRRCGGHLGHVFDDGPTPTGDRYCINSCALAFEPAPPAHGRDQPGRPG